ncbi:MAG TPA: DUF2059 domain-containing protein [Bryobacteraceae bacterium]|nr:DUF2059 domain-containing protein [Bryobacteraceae bacterium]
MKTHLSISPSLNDIVAFYKTPSGQSLLEKMPELIAKSSQIGQAQMRGATAEIQGMTAAFMNDLLKKPITARRPSSGHASHLFMQRNAGSNVIRNGTTMITLKLLTLDSEPETLAT